MLHFIKFIYKSFAEALSSAFAVTSIVGIWLCIPTLLATIFFSGFVAFCYILLFLSVFVIMLLVNLTSEGE